jgi:cell division protein FtsW
MLTFARGDTSIVGRWWWTVDRWTLLAIGLLILAGSLLSLAASPPVAGRIGLDALHFSSRHFMFLMPAVLILIGASLLSPRGVRRVAVVGFVAAYVLMLATLLVGPEVKGATRWLHLGGFSLQPSEFAKPFFVVVAAWLFAEKGNESGVPTTTICCAVFVLLLAVLIAQPDFGMTVVVTAVWAVQFFIAGLSALWISFFVVAGVVGAVTAYLTIPHVASRIDRFLDPSTGDSYQIDRAMDAFSRGGLLGQGPGEGKVKEVLPDAHTDFIFSVAAEEYGLFLCLLIVGLFAFVTLRGFIRLLREEDLFVLLAATGLLSLFALQAVVNIGVNLNLLPTKGMTLPFISYGGSSLMATALTVGMLLALTRRRPGSGGAS